MSLRSDDASRQRRLTAAAIVALLAVAVGVFGGMYALARGGTFDELLRRTPTLVVIAPTRTATLVRTATQPPMPTQTSVSSATLVATLTISTVAPIGSVVVAPSITPPIVATNTSTPTEAPTPPASPAPTGRYVVEYLGCDPRGSDIGIVKGQIFDRQGRVVVGAEVRVLLDDWAYDQPATSNGEGWYEFYLQKGLKVKIASLRIEGKEMTLSGNQDQVFLAQGGCFEYVNLREK